jgi:chromate reductase
LRSAPQKQPIPNTARSVRSGNGGTMRWPVTKWVSPTGIGVLRPRTASSAEGMRAFFVKNMSQYTSRHRFGYRVVWCVMAGVALLGICGSMRRASLNRRLLAAIGELLPHGTRFSEIDGLDQLPIFNSDLEDPRAVTDLKAAIASADGVIFAVPEYNYSIPGGLKNALDWVSRPPQTSPMRGKPIGLVGAATGMSGTIRAQTHMRQMLIYSDSPCLLQPEVLIPRAHERFDAEGQLVDRSTRELLEKFGAAMVAFVERHRG